MSDLAESTEALKRNFFFRGFFNKRGYFDLDDVSVQQYRQGALETKDRRVVRIWISAAVLFETDANGQERLTDDGRARLDSAMSQFVRYPRNTPFVVEGYAPAPTVDRQFLLSRSRARLVTRLRGGEVRARPQITSPRCRWAPMPTAAPPERQWDGVALAMFVRRRHCRGSRQRPQRRRGQTRRFTRFLVACHLIVSGMDRAVRTAHLTKEGNVDERSRVLLATCIGAVAGGVWGWLYMTENGRRVRDQIEPKLDDFMRETPSRARDRREGARRRQRGMAVAQ